MNRKSCAQLKLEGRQLLKGKYGVVVGVMVIFSVLLMMVAGLIQGCFTFAMMGSMISESPQSIPSMQIKSMIMSMLPSLLVVIAEYTLIPGYLKLHLNICTGQPYEVGDLFFAFKNHLLKFICLALCLWLLSLIVVIPMVLIGLIAIYMPGAAVIALGIVVFIATYIGLIIIMMNLSMVMYIMVENPETGVIDCMKESFRIMKGNKLRLFYIGLSFIGVYLLATLSFGIGYLWVAPYMSITITLFYLDIRTSVKDDTVQTWQASAPYDYQNPV